MAKQHRALQRQPSTDKEGRERVHFAKVCFKAFESDIRKFYSEHIDQETLRKAWEEIVLPERKTQFSCGYDVRTPINLVIAPHTSVIVPTGIRVIFSDDEMKTWCLKLYARSSIGIKDKVIVTNSVGLVDADYYLAENSGDMLLALTNIGNEIRKYKAGDRICQAVFEIYGLTSDDKAVGVRTNGVGSTGTT